MFGLFRPKTGKRRLGADIAGVVEATGREVTRFTPGDAVFGDLWNSWGGFAELACISETAVEPKPANLSFEQAAAVPQAAVLALGGYNKRPPSQAGQKVLINGAGGGVGSFAIQLAKLDGAEVTGVDAAHKLEAVTSFGADHVLDYKREDFTQRGIRYDLVLDCNLSRSLRACRRALAPGGSYAVVGGETWRILSLMVNRFLASRLGRGIPFHVVMDGPNKGLDALNALLQAGKIVPRIDRIFALDEVPEALAYFGAGQHTGKVVIAVR